MPIGLLAVLLQVLAPAWGFATVARALADPLRDATLCFNHDGDTRDAPAPQHHAMCPVCVAAGVTHAALPSGPVALPAPRTQPIPRHPHRMVAMPRGPPAFAPRARAPPALT